MNNQLETAKAWLEGLQPPTRETAEERIAIKMESGLIAYPEALLQTHEELCINDGQT